MPFKVKFQIFEPGKLAPCFTTYDARLAHVEYRHLCNQKGCALTRMTTDIECIDLTRPEQYVFLVYRVRKAISRFYNDGRKPEDLQASLELERQLPTLSGHATSRSSSSSTSGAASGTATSTTKDSTTATSRWCAKCTRSA